MACLPLLALAATLVVQPGMGLQQAIARAHPGDRVEVRPGTYAEHVVVGVPRLTLAGGLVEDPDRIAVERRRLRRAAPCHGGNFRDERVCFSLGGFRIAAGGIDEPRRHALLVVEKRLQQMRGRDSLLMLPNGDRLGCLKEAARTVGELFKIHIR